VTSVYDAERAHVRAMGIWHLYLAPDRSVTRRCRPLPRDVESALPSVPGRSEPPAVTVPLTGLDDRGQAVTIDRPPGPTTMAGSRVDVRVDDLAYRIRNLSVPLDATVRWRFHGSAYHDVTVANGPVGFASRWSLRGDSFSRRFRKPGTYRLFCSLHPIAMTQVIDVRAAG
jgi:plastocyanin